MGTHDPSVCVSTTLSAFVVAKDEGDMVENVRCPMLTELVREIAGIMSHSILCDVTAHREAGGTEWFVTL